MYAAQNHPLCGDCATKRPRSGITGDDRTSDRNRTRRQGEPGSLGRRARDLSSLHRSALFSPKKMKRVGETRRFVRRIRVHSIGETHTCRRAEPTTVAATVSQRTHCIFIDFPRNCAVFLRIPFVLGRTRCCNALRRRIARGHVRRAERIAIARAHTIRRLSLSSKSTGALARRGMCNEFRFIAANSRSTMRRSDASSRDRCSSRSRAKTGN